MENTSIPPQPDPAVQLQPPTPPSKGDQELEALKLEVRKRAGEVEQLKLRVMAQPAQQQQQQQPLDQTQLKAEFFKNPLEMSAAIAQRAVYEATKNIGVADFDTLVTIAREKAREKDPAIFDKYSLEIDALVTSSVDPQFRKNINVWTNAFNQVRGNHIDDILELKKAEAPRGPAIHVSQQGGPAQSSSRSIPPPADEKLSEREIYTARKLGITKEQYQAGKRFLEEQNEKGSSSWDKFMTTSTKELRRRQRDERNTAKAGGK